VKHAQATHVTVSIRRQQNPDGICCDVADNGIGFDTKQHAPAPDTEMGFGLFSIREQLRQYGGTFALETNPGSGTRVVLRLPLKTENPCDGGGRHEDPGNLGG
jgi:signal transduction histidine kinase